MPADPYYSAFAAAYVRGMAQRTALPLPDRLSSAPLESLTQSELEALLAIGKAAELKLYRFKRTHDDLPRVRRVISFLRSIPFQTLLDVGSGRGVFLWPFLDAFPAAEVTSLDLLAHRVDFLQAVADGGIARLRPVQADIGAYGGQSADVVTLLEVLEHIPDVAAAVHNSVRLARSYVVVSVPSQPDDNPEHIHLLTREKLAALFTDAGCTKLHFDGVNGHLILFARKAP